MKKSYRLSERVKRTKEKEENTMNLAAHANTEIKDLARMSDSEIDYSDIPELGFDDLGRPVVGKFYRPIKKPISIQMDIDVLEWFKSQSVKYQSLINQVCRMYDVKHRKK
ncbi:MAG: BrnA antitoxin family protein [Proteobacteria bacterium]|nr:BrnA antitoxin family protein [Pseudomonadota bacterium]